MTHTQIHDTPCRRAQAIVSRLPFGRERGPDDLLELREGDGVVAVRVGEGEHPLDSLVVRLGVDRPDGDLELGNADLAVAAGVDRVEDRAQLLVGEAAAAGPVDRRLGGELRPRGEHLVRDRAQVRARVRVRMRVRVRVGTGRCLVSDRLRLRVQVWQGSDGSQVHPRGGLLRAP